MDEISKSVANLKGILGPSRNNGSLAKNQTRPIVFGEPTVLENESVDNYTYHLGKSFNQLWSGRSKDSTSLENKLVQK
jgi:hypothetical protein